ncbi:hypothetical protein OROHE_002951 [Orobanche hederae]
MRRRDLASPAALDWICRKETYYACLSLSLHQFPPSPVILVGSNNQQDQVGIGNG